MSMKGHIRIDFEFNDQGQLKLMVNAPLSSQAEKNAMLQVIANAIPIITYYQEPAIIASPSLSGLITPNGKKPIPKTH